MTDLEQLRAHVEFLRWVKVRKAELAEQETAARTAIQDAMGGDESGVLDGVEVVTWKAHKRRALDQKALKTKLPDVVDLYSIYTEVRRFEVVDL